MNAIAQEAGPAIEPAYTDATKNCMIRLLDQQVGVEVQKAGCARRQVQHVTIKILGRPDVAVGEPAPDIGRLMSRADARNPQHRGGCPKVSFPVSRDQGSGTQRSGSSRRKSSAVYD